MYYLFLVIIIIVAILMLLIVLVQNSKGGGLASEFSSANQYGGVVQTNKYLEKATWILAVAIVSLSILASLTIPKQQKEEGASIVQEQVNNQVDYSSSIPTITDQTQNPTQQKNTTEGNENK
jgi:preprotein translocase subunit SecG